MLWSWFFGNAWEALIVCTENGKKLFVDLAYCVLVGSSANNDINVLDNSSLFDDILDDKAPVAPYVGPIRSVLGEAKYEVCYQSTKSVIYRS
ncbi:ALP1-like protein [Tanacetum coccineum]